jgi:adenylate cyclase
MEKDRERRYQSAEALLNDLQNIEDGHPLGTKIRPRRETFVAALIRKKLFMPAVVIVLAIITAVIWHPWSKHAPAPPTSDSPSIAILSFEDLTPDKEYEYLCDGMAETLINSLSPVKELKVSARTSAFSFKGKEQDIREIGQKLGVKNVLEGSIQVAGNKIRVTARLSNAEDGFQLWSDSYNRELDDIFSIQDDIAQTVVSTLKIQLLGEAKGTIVKRHTENIEAYNLYLQGRFLWNKRTEDGLRRAIEIFEQALELDSDYALALVGISDCYNQFPYYGYSSPNDAFPKAKEAILKALEMDNMLSEAHTSLAYIKSWYDWDWEGAEKEFNQAIDLNPGYASAHHWYSSYLSFMGRTDEAKKEIEKALELDPISLAIKRDESYPYFYNREYEKAIEILLNVIEIDPNYPWAHGLVGHVYLCKAKYDKALKEYKEERIIRMGADIFGIDAWIGITYANMGKKEEARQLLNELIELSKHEFISPVLLARLSFDLGENTLYKYWLDKVVEEKDIEITWLITSPVHDNLRSDEAVIELLKKVNLLDK